MIGVHFEAGVTVLFQGVTRIGPSEDAAIEIADIGMTGGDEAAGESGAAVTSGTVDDEGLIGRELMEQSGGFGFGIDA